jgi:hypothetical protein
LALSLTLQAALASDPSGVYALVDKVLTDSDEQTPTVRILGIFSLSERREDHALYTPPIEGYMYFTCPAGQDEVCLAEWTDMSQTAGSGKCVAFGGRYLTDPQPNGRVRPMDEPPAQPDVYPIAGGVSLVDFGWQGTCDALKLYRTVAAHSLLPSAQKSGVSPGVPPLREYPEPGASLNGTQRPASSGTQSRGLGPRQLGWLALATALTVGLGFAASRRWPWA